MTDNRLNQIDTTVRKEGELLVLSCTSRGETAEFKTSRGLMLGMTRSLGLKAVSAAINGSSVRIKFPSGHLMTLSSKETASLYLFLREEIGRLRSPSLFDQLSNPPGN